jgi:DNA repair protein RecO (recombination protein O)
VPPVTTRAVVLQSWRYSETSKIVRLATRDLGVQSAIAKGALRPRSRFGAGLESLSEGIAHLYHRETRDLQILGAFDLIDLRRGLARDVGRFAGAAALAEIVLRMAPPAPLPSAYDALVAGCDALVRAPVDQIDATALRAVWGVLGALGFEPSLARCARDGNAVDSVAAAPVGFSVAEGGVLCERCGAAAEATALPPRAYRDLLALNDPAAELPALDVPHAAAHRRLVTRFIRHHYGETGGLNAVDFWTRRPWAAAS